MRRTFPCGHAGKGKYCHRCDAPVRAQAKADAVAAAREQVHVDALARAKERARLDAEARAKAKADTEAREERERCERREQLRRIVAEANIDLAPVAHLPAVCERAASVLTQLAAGVHPFNLKGKALGTTDNRLISIPVGLSYRLLVERDSRRPLRILSHETYNRVVCGSASARAYL